MPIPVVPNGTSNKLESVSMATAIASCTSTTVRMRIRKFAAGSRPRATDRRTLFTTLDANLRWDAEATCSKSQVV